jgi:hypothetical protein
MALNSTVSYLVSISNKTNSTQQTRRRINQTVSAVSEAQTSVNTANTNISEIQGQLASGFSGTVPLAKLTGGGANGSITVQNGLITAVVEPT